MKQSKLNLLQGNVMSLLSQWKENDGELFRKMMDDRHEFSIRRLNIDTDLFIIHKWVNMDYAREYWQMNGTFELLKDTYDAVQKNPNVGSFIGCLDGVVVCQMDVYNPKNDVISDYYDYQEGDLGIHLLLGPDKIMITNFSAKVVLAFAAWLFSSGHVERLITEPDKNSRASNWLLRRIKFMFISEINLPEKTANLFSMTGQGFDNVPKEFL